MKMMSKKNIRIIISMMLSLCFMFSLVQKPALAKDLMVSDEDEFTIDEELVIEGPVDINNLEDLLNYEGDKLENNGVLYSNQSVDSGVQAFDLNAESSSTTPSALSVEIVMSYDDQSFTFTDQNNVHNANDIYKTSNISWSYNVIGGTSDDVADVEWTNQKSSYATYDNQTVKLRILDKEGYWSDYSDVTFHLTNRKPIANLKYIIMNKDSLKNGKITTDTQIAWLWSYGDQKFTYDPDGDAISNLKVDGIGQNDIVGSLTGNIGFVTKFSTAAQYTMEFKCADSEGLWSDTYKINIEVEPADSNNRPVVTGLTYSPVVGPLDTQFSFRLTGFSDADGDNITSLGYKVVKDGSIYPMDQISIVQSGTTVKMTFNDFGFYDVHFRVCDTKGAWSNWIAVRIEVKDLKDTPNGESVQAAWSKIKSTPGNATNHEAFSRSIPKSSKYLGYTEVNGVRQYYYLMTFEDKYKYTSSNYLATYDSFVVYNQNYKVPNPYHNGYFGAWYPEGTISLNKGIFSADVGFKKYKHTGFGDYRRLHIYDFIYNKDYTFEYADHGLYKPYFVSDKMSNEDSIVYGRAYWFKDGSGNSTITRINRKTGTSITNNNIVFGTNSEIQSGRMIDDTRYAFISTQKGNKLTILNTTNVQVIKTLSVDKVYSISLNGEGDIVLTSGSEKLIVDKDTLTFK